METLETLQRRRRVAQELHTVVRMMKGLAAAHIRQYELAVDSMSLYGHTIALGLQVVLRALPHLLPSKVKSKNPRLILVWGSDHGMCGQFNREIAKYTSHHIVRDTDDRVIVIGNRLAAEFELLSRKPQAVFPIPNQIASIYEIVEDLIIHIDRYQEKEGFETVLLVYHQLRSQTRYRVQTLLPIDTKWLSTLQKKPWRSKNLPIFTMDRSKLLSSLLRQHLLFTLYHAFAESLASESSYRLASMQKAEKSIEERLEILSAQYHQKRQEQITEELLDVSAGFAALQKS